MLAIRSIVPGFGRALAASPALERLWNAMAASNGVTLRGRALISVAVARKVGGPYADWVMRQAALRQGLTEEEVLLASTGSAHDPMERGLVRYAVKAVSAAPEDLDREDPVLRCVHAALAHAVLTCRVLQTLAPATAPASARKGA